MISFVIIGSGYRSEYYARVVRTYPDIFSALYLCRSAEKAELIQRRTGIQATTSVEACLSFSPDFVVVTVDRVHVADVALDWAGKGFPVLTETPVASTPDQLRRLKELAQKGAKIVCCEQYHRQPLIAAALEEIEKGTIGEPYSMYISAFHDYHAPGIIRKALHIAPEEPYEVHVRHQEYPVVQTDSRESAYYDGHVVTESRTIAVITFRSGKTAVYDFSPAQYRSYIRSRHITVRGTRGEWTDTLILYLDQHNEPQRKMLLPEIPEAYRHLDTQALRDARRNWKAELAPDTLQDEFAIAAMLQDMGDYANNQRSAPYSFAEAAADARFWFELISD